MRFNFVKIGLLVFSFYIGTINAEVNLEVLTNKFYNENISKDDIEHWINQFDPEDRESAILLLEQIHYYSYKSLINDLRSLHKKLLVELREDGFIEGVENEMTFDKVDFSKTYPAKSGDLISYFYRSSNLIRAVAFKNLSDLTTDTKNHSNKALIILEDYVGTGTQFLFELYSKRYHELFNSYKKVYFVVLVATDGAIKRFEKVNKGEYDSLAEDFISIIGIKDAKNGVVEAVSRIPKDKLEILYLHKEIPLNDSSRDPNITNKISALLNKYNIKRYLGGTFSSFGHTVFFYNCPNNLPEILWNSQSIHRNGNPWIPLFKRVEDLSIYEMSKNIPVENQIW